MNRNAEQQRAAYALTKIKAVADKLNQDIEDKNRKEWRSRATELPAMIQMNGLGQTIAFYRSKAAQDSYAHRTLVNIVQQWLCRETGIYSDDDLIDAIANGDMHLYRIAQAETQALLIWVKKFSRIYITDKKAEAKNE